jgi:hypothetical protein
MIELHAACAVLNCGEVPAAWGTRIAIWVPPFACVTWGSGKLARPWFRMHAAYL